jgi:hypothetical protein
MKKILNKLKVFFKYIFSNNEYPEDNKSIFDVKYFNGYKFEKVIFFNNQPSELEKSTIYIIGEKEYKWMISFYCPCGCGDVIKLNLLEDASPRWRYRINNHGLISIAPSINRNLNCYSHFTIKNSITNQLF